MPLRLAQRADAEEIVELVNSVYRGEAASRSWTSEADLLEGLRIDEPTFLALLERPGNFILKLESDQQILGCVQLTEESSRQSFHLGMLSVRLDQQGSGLGSRILALAENYARQELGAQRITMSVISVRKELLQWYERRGYRATGESYPFSGDSTQLSHSKRGPLTFLVLQKSLV